LDNLFVYASGKGSCQLDRSTMLDPTKKDVNGKTCQGPAADPLGLPLPEKAEEEREKDDTGEDDVDDKDQIPRKTMFKERRKDHRAIGGEKIEQDVTNQNREADLIKAPKMISLRYLDENPAEEESVERNKYQRMSKVPVMLEVELTIEKAKDEIGVRKESCDQTRNRPPIPDFFIIDRPGNHSTCKRMGNTVHDS
jgi:hypothetical protein